MDIRDRITGLFVGLLLGVCVLTPAFGQTPTSEQLEIFRQLTPEQQQQILKQVGGRAGSAGSAGGATRADRSAAQGAQADGTLPERRQRAAFQEFQEELDGKLKAEDTLVIEIDFTGKLRERKGTPQRPEGAAPVTATTGAGAAGAPLAAAQNPPPTQGQALSEQRPLPPLERERLQALIDLIRARNPYQLDRSGVLHLPGFAGIALGGLTEEQATLRLSVEPALQGVDLRLTRLPLARRGPEGLKPFGYDLFESAPSTFAPVTEVPVPSDYIVGPGDELQVQLYGNQNRNLTLTVGRDGRVNFPELGPISVSGQRFPAVRAALESRVERQMIGVRASVSMGETRAIRVFVLGEAKFPGTYTISGLGTVTSALFAAGGVQPIGSLRDIQLKRQGQVVRRLDLYDLLIHGDTSDDAKLLPGDVIFIPPVGPTVSIDGEVRRPAIYELKRETTLDELLQIAGGLTPEADATRTSLVRIDEQRRRVVENVDLAAEVSRARPLRNGDLLRVARLRPTLDSGVQVRGQVFRPGPVAWREGLRLTEVIGSLDELMPNADQNYLLIRRELPPDRRVAVLSADLEAALRNPGGPADIVLMPRDQITVFDYESGRDRIIQPILNELRLQSRIDRPTEVVHVSGRVKVPGEYPLEPGMKVSDLVRAGGNLQAAAYGGKAELTRYSIDASGERRAELIEVDLAAVQRREAGADLTLEPFDSLIVKEVPLWSDREEIELLGEVRFPGIYTIRRDESLSSVIERAGGLTRLAFPDGAVFTREELRVREQEQLDNLAKRLRGDVTTLALQGAAANQGQATQALAVGQSLLAQLQDTKAVGRLVIDLREAVSGPPGNAADIRVREGDRLIVPRMREEVTVIGEVQNATSHFYRPDLVRDDYIGLSGGVTRKADDGKIYVVRANGSVVANEGNRWFSRSSNVQMKPGDTVVVPLDTERLPALPFWQAVTGILYNVAISVAAIKSF